MQENIKNWYAVRVLSGSENKVKATINNGAAQRNLTDAIGEIIIATESVSNNKTKKVTVKNLYPGYIFINMQMNSQTKNLVSSAASVIGFAGGNKTPIPMPSKEIEAIISTLNKSAKKESDVVFANLSIGDRVNISNCALSGSIKALDPAKNRVQVGVLVFDREVLMEVKPDQVSKVA